MCENILISDIIPYTALPLRYFTKSNLKSKYINLDHPLVVAQSQNIDTISYVLHTEFEEHKGECVSGQNILGGYLIKYSSGGSGLKDIEDRSPSIELEENLEGIEGVFIHTCYWNDMIGQYVHLGATYLRKYITTITPVNSAISKNKRYIQFSLTGGDQSYHDQLTLFDHCSNIIRKYIYIYIYCR